MPQARPHLHCRSILLALLLAAALLGAQWIGAMHRVVHSGLIQGPHATVATGSHASLADWTAALSHSCAAFDAATLVDAITPSTFTLPATPDLYEIAQQVAFASWTAPVVHHFSSRAPPLA